MKATLEKLVELKKLKFNQTTIVIPAGFWRESIYGCPIETFGHDAELKLRHYHSVGLFESLLSKFNLVEKFKDFKSKYGE
ncbi:MAG: hypothetical protein HYV29_15270 [Ignavibacteriales bacterium]|nr:hypothetical protein [Ignavibacteriales bacterium]